MRMPISVDLCAKGLKDPAHIGILQCKSKLNPEKSKTHVPQSAEKLSWSYEHGQSLEL